MILVDACVAAAFSAGYVWLSAKCWADLAKRPAAPRRRWPASGYGERVD